MSEDETYTPEEYENHIEKLAAHIESLQGKNTGLSKDLASSAYSSKDGNLIHLQLETPELLQRLEHFYRGDYLHTDEATGDVVWKKQKDKNLIPLNSYGVSLLMELITKYLDKNTVLSNYKEERIYEILGDIGDEVTLVVLCNYEKMGMDNYFKKTKFRMIVVTTLHIIESTYRRAIDGQTSEDLNQSRIVTQSDSMGRPMNSMMSPQKKKPPWWNPKGW